MMPKKLKKLVKASRISAKARPVAAAKKPRATARVSALVDKDLLAQAERYAKARRTTVADVVAEGLRKVLGGTRAPVLPPADAEPGAADAGAWGHMLAWMEEQQSALTEIRNALGDVAAALPNEPAPPASRPRQGPRIPPL